MPMILITPLSALAGAIESHAPSHIVTLLSSGYMIDTPQGKTPFSFFLTIPAIHLYGHAAQIDYLQTCWGDQEVHLSPRARARG